MRASRVLLTIVFSVGLGVCGRQSSSAKDLAKQKNSDIENIGSRDVNAGQINFMSIAKEIALGRQLAQEVERASKLVDEGGNERKIWLNGSWRSPVAKLGATPGSHAGNRSACSVEANP